jgi:hypothetical protein
LHVIVPAGSSRALRMSISHADTIGCAAGSTRSRAAGPSVALSHLVQTTPPPDRS